MCEISTLIDNLAAIASNQGSGRVDAVWGKSSRSAARPRIFTTVEDRIFPANNVIESGCIDDGAVVDGAGRNTFAIKNGQSIVTDIPQFCVWQVRVEDICGERAFDYLDAIL